MRRCPEPFRLFDGFPATSSKNADGVACTGNQDSRQQSNRFKQFTALIVQQASHGHAAWKNYQEEIDTTGRYSLSQSQVETMSKIAATPHLKRGLSEIEQCAFRDI